MVGGAALLKPGVGVQGAHGELGEEHEGGREGGAGSLRTETGDRPELSGAHDGAAGVLKTSVQFSSLLFVE